MLLKNKLNIRYFDYLLLALFLLLSIIGIFIIYSATFNPGSKVSVFYIKQIYWLILGLIIFICFSLINYRYLINYAYIFYVVGLLVLAFVLINGYIGRGAQSWIDLGLIRVQPSELFKVIWVIVLARLFSDFNLQKLGLIKIIIRFLVVLPPFLLIFYQPDLGTAGLLVLLWCVLLLFRGIQFRAFLILSIFSFCLVVVLWANLHDYQRDRVLTFINPSRDPFGSGYHLIQSKVAIGSGGLYGKGYLKGTQSQLNFLPEQHTDFVFSVLSEEFGFVGALFLIVLYMLLIIRILYIALIAREICGKLLCVGVATLLFIHFYINAAMTIGYMPIVGIPMPFISYGGSITITASTLLGIANSVSIRRFQKL
ncbi:MAG: rod shape-determining protein RodA [Deferribacterota bacterium]|nr:rod shape-determining protein RodA [Deferribacterota bacterium]